MIDAGSVLEPAAVSLAHRRDRNQVSALSEQFLAVAATDGHADGGAGPLDAGRESDMPFSEGGLVRGLAKERRASGMKQLVDWLIDQVVAAGGLEWGGPHVTTLVGIVSPLSS